jgi:hypothetical protein
MPSRKARRGVVEDVRTFQNDTIDPQGGSEFVRELQRLCAEEDPGFLHRVERVSELKALMAARAEQYPATKQAL